MLKQHYLKLLVITVMILKCNSQPEPVWTDNCINVTNAGTCAQCIDGFYLQYFLCLPCAPLCICTSQYNYCQSCISLSYNKSPYNFTLVLKMENTRCYFCQQFIPNCLSCSSTNTCTICYGGYYPVNQTNSQGVTISASCSTTQCQDACDICTDEKHCQYCAPGYFLDNSTKICSNGTCGANCTVCSSSQQCQNCTVGYFLNSTTNSCQFCNISDCVICTNTSYCQICAPGYYSMGTNCTSTGFSNCVLYIGGADAATGCQVCEPGYFVLYSNCFQCVGCELCSLQFLCQSPCFSNATQFNYACLVPTALYSWQLILFLMVNLGLVLVI